MSSSPAARAAIVTGASSGIGLAIAEVLADEGYGLTLAARDGDKLDTVVEELEAHGVRAQGVTVSFGRDPDAVTRVIEAHRETFGRLDVLVNNAAVATGAPIEEMREDRIDLQIDVNLRTVISTYRQAIPMLRAAGLEHRNALVVNTSSISASVPEPGVSVYAATKAAIVTFTHAMNKELGPAGVKNTALCPGMVRTPMTAHYQDVIPADEMIRPEDVAEVVRALLHMSPACVVAEVELQRPGGVRW